MFAKNRQVTDLLRRVQQLEAQVYTLQYEVRNATTIAVPKPVDPFRVGDTAWHNMPVGAALQLVLAHLGLRLNYDRGTPPTTTLVPDQEVKS